MIMTVGKKTFGQDAALLHLPHIALAQDVLAMIVEVALQLGVLTHLLLRTTLSCHAPVVLKALVVQGEHMAVAYPDVGQAPPPLQPYER